MSTMDRHCEVWNLHILHTNVTGFLSNSQYLSRGYRILCGTPGYRQWLRIRYSKGVRRNMVKSGGGQYVITYVPRHTNLKFGILEMGVAWRLGSSLGAGEGSWKVRQGIQL